MLNWKGAEKRNQRVEVKGAPGQDLSMRSSMELNSQQAILTADDQSKEHVLDQILLKVGMDQVKMKP